MLNLKNDSDEDKLERRGGEKRRGEGSLSGRGDVSQARGRSVGELFSGDIHVWYLGAHSVPLPPHTHTFTNSYYFKRLAGNLYNGFCCKVEKDKVHKVKWLC